MKVFCTALESKCQEICKCVKTTLTQSKSKTQITRSVHGKFKCIAVKYNGTQRSI